MIQTALTLLLTAYSLLIQVQNSPNAPIEVRNQATIVANQAISFAQAVISNQSIQSSQTSISTQQTSDKPLEKASCTLTSNTVFDTGGNLVGAITWNATEESGWIKGIKVNGKTGTVKGFTLKPNTINNFDGEFGNAVCATTIDMRQN